MQLTLYKKNIIFWRELKNMTSVTNYPSTISQTSGGVYCKFGNVNNIKNSSATFAEASIGMKTEIENRPSVLTLTNFQFNIPSNAKISKIDVAYAHYKKDCSIPAPTITLLNVTNTSGKGTAPTNVNKKYLKSFKVSPSVAKVNSSSFGVKINYPANTSKKDGSLFLEYVRIIITYSTPSYSLSIKSLTKSYLVGSTVGFRLNINNLKKLDYNPRILITIPSGTSLSGSLGGSLTKVNSTQYVWNAKLSSKVISSQITVYLKLNSIGANQKLTVTEQVNNTSKSFTFTIKQKSGNIIEVPSDDPYENESISFDDEIVIEPISYVTFNRGESTAVKISVSDEVWNKLPYETTYIQNDGVVVQCNGVLRVYVDSTQSYSVWHNLGQSDFDDTHSITLYFKSDTTGVGGFNLSFEEHIIVKGMNVAIPIWFKEYVVNVVPPKGDLTWPICSVFRVEGEELDRLGHPMVYTVQSWMKLVTNELYVRDWGQNFRIGVFNNAISSNVSVSSYTDENGEIVETITDTTDYTRLTLKEIFDNAAYWSEPPTSVNTYENIEVNFPYNENYPVYIIFTGDYMEGDSINSTIKYSAPCLVESEVYNGYEPEGNYPQPILATISADDDFAELVLPAMAEGNKIVLYDPDVDEDFGTDDEWAVKGIKLTADVEFYDDLIVYAQLQQRIDNEVRLGNRSVILDTRKDIEELVIGANNDTWGLKISELKNLKDLEIELYAANLLYEDSQAAITFNNIQLTFTLQKLKKYVTDMWVNGEDVRYYGMFIKSVKIPKGLETDVKYLEVEGSDINEGFNQTIDKKEIEIEFRVLGCDINETTQMMQDIAKLFTNERDELNRPIPNRLDLSMFPNDHLEFIMEDAIDDEIDAANFEGKMKLVIPKGTFIANEDSVTSTYGHIFSIAKVNPILRCRSCDSRVEITEEYSNQKFTIDLSEISVVNDAGNTITGITASDILEIDCVNQNAYIINASDDVADVTNYVDMHSDWFILSKGEYYFSSPSCIIQTVTTTERN